MRVQRVARYLRQRPQPHKVVQICSQECRLAHDDEPKPILGEVGRRYEVYRRQPTAFGGSAQMHQSVPNNHAHTYWRSSYYHNGPCDRRRHCRTRREQYSLHRTREIGWLPPRRRPRSQCIMVSYLEQEFRPIKAILQNAISELEKFTTIYST